VPASAVAPLKAFTNAHCHIRTKALNQFLQFNEPVDDDGMCRFLHPWIEKPDAFRKMTYLVAMLSKSLCEELPSSAAVQFILTDAGRVYD